MTRPERALHVWLPTFFGLVLAGPFCLDAVRDPDAGWHLAVGRALASMGMFRENLLSWTAPHQHWYPTSWLFDLAAYALTVRLGLLGFQLLTLTLLAVALGFLALACARLHPRGAWLVPAGAALLVPRIAERPHMASWALLAAAMAAGLSRSFRWRAAVAAAVALGGNLHAGAVFAAGLLGLFCAENFLAERRPRDLLVAVAGLVGLVTNPGGLFNLRYAVAHLSVQETVALEEFLPPSWREAPFFAFAPLALVLAWRERRRRPALLAAVVVFAGLGLTAGRLVYKFYLVALPCLALALDPLRGYLGGRAVPTWAAAALLSAAAGSRLPARYLAWRPAAEFSSTELPVRAADYAHRRGLTGPLFNSFRDGGYLAWTLPGVGVYQDGRVQAYPPALFQTLERTEGRPAEFQALLREQGVTWAITSRWNERLAGFRLLDSPEWALVYWDERSEVFLRRDVERFASVIALDEYRHFRPYGSIVGAVAAVPAEALPRYTAEVDRYLSGAPDDPWAHLVACALAVRAGAQDRDARCARAEALATTPPQRTLLARALALKER